MKLISKSHHDRVSDICVVTQLVLHQTQSQTGWRVTIGTL